MSVLLKLNTGPQGRWRRSEPVLKNAVMNKASDIIKIHTLYIEFNMLASELFKTMMQTCGIPENLNDPLQLKTQF